MVSGIIAALAGAKTLVVSLMGDDVRLIDFFGLLYLFFTIFFGIKLLVNHQDMFDTFGKKGVAIISQWSRFTKVSDQFSKGKSLEVLVGDEKKSHSLTSKFLSVLLKLLS